MLANCFGTTTGVKIDAHVLCFFRIDFTSSKEGFTGSNLDLSDGGSDVAPPIPPKKKSNAPKPVGIVAPFNPSNDVCAIVLVLTVVRKV